MSTQITTAFVEQYSANVYMLAQQKASRLASAVDVEMVKGKNAYFERIGSATAQLKTGRHDDTPQIDTPHTRRRVSLEDYVWADLIDNEDQVRTLIDPTGHYAKVGAMAMGRTIDDIIISAALGNAFEGVAGGTTTALTTGQKIAVASAGLTIAKMVSAKKILDAAEIDPEAPRFMAVSAEQIEDLLNNTTVTSSDYNTVKALVAGEIDTFLGFRMIRTERLNTDSNGDRQVIAWSQPALKLAIGMAPKARISERDDKHYATQVYFSMSLGATRMEEEGVVEIACSE